MTTLIIGASGQVARALKAELGTNAVCYGHAHVDCAQPDAVRAFLNAQPVPEAIINASAYTAVDKAESEEDIAYRINAESPAIMAEYCKKHNIPFVHYSTDYVFPGTGTAPWKETDATAPLNAYGRTKRAGEEKIEAIGGHYLIFRTSWVYDKDGANFLNTMLRLGREREALSIVNDQHGAPTYAPHLAHATLAILEKPPVPGIYHLCGHGETTWYDFARAIFARAEGLKVTDVKGIPSSAYPTPAKRPHNSRMSMEKVEKTYGIRMPEWETGLDEAMVKK